ncbi:MAG: hypothetical protein JWO45_200, partial [Spartobacteria bacterium]|nr:hypothetical protein [Spartobacteria bacterium]
MKSRKSGVNRDESADAAAGAGLSPRGFLKERRPEQFSDSVVEEDVNLDRSFLEYHLESLTSRSQELLFENFARKLAQKTLCPNLMPHTGPTGGGDSKVDSETYPVAEAIAETWYVGVASEAASERWAFAFSAKKDWQPKAVSDVEKIVGTGRGYKVAYFISNQFISDKNRAKNEDALKEKHGLDVRILDRSWILDRVFENGLEELAISELNIAIAARRVVRVGPLDAERQKELHELETSISGAAEDNKFDSVYVGDCIDSAVTARELELPQTDVEGRFLRAEKVAKKWGTPQQQLQAYYQRARTLYFWLEEFDELPELYLSCERLVTESNSAFDLELLMNTFCCLLTISKWPESGVSSEWISERARVFLSTAERLASDSERPSNALQAKSHGLLVQLTLSPLDDCGPILLELREVVENCEGLVGFPARPLFDVIVDLGMRFGESAEYEALFESTVRMTSSREGELTTAKMLLHRGRQMLGDERPSDVIRVVGRALRMLYKHESRKQFVSALQLIGVAYQQIGLLWAARGAMLAAASIVCGDFYTYGDISSRLASCAKNLKWIELELGRITQSLDWHQLEFCVRDILARQDKEEFSPFDVDYGAVLGLVCLRLSFQELSHMTRMADVFERLDLPIAAVALKYSLGHEDGLPLRELGFEDDPVAGFCQWRDQPAGQQLVNPVDVGESDTCSLTSIVIGCRVEASVSRDPACIVVAETVLAGLEGLLSTSLSATVLPIGPRIPIRIEPDDNLTTGIEFERVDDDGLASYVVRSSRFNPHKLGPDELGVVLNGIRDLLFDIIARGFLIRNIEKHLEKILRDEDALERAINFTQSFIHIG